MAENTLSYTTRSEYHNIHSISPDNRNKQKSRLRFDESIQHTDEESQQYNESYVSGAKSDFGSPAYPCQEIVTPQQDGDVLSQ